MDKMPYFCMEKCGIKRCVCLTCINNIPPKGTRSCECDDWDNAELKHDTPNSSCNIFKKDWIRFIKYG